MVNKRILALVAAHCVIGILSAMLSTDRPAVSSAVLIAIVLSQSSLVGMWGGLGGTHCVVRLIVVFVSTIYLFAELGLGIGEFEWEVYFLVALPTFLVGTVCWVVRLVWASLRIEDGRMERSTQEGLQFSIRHMMWLTLFVACLLTLGKLFMPEVGGLGNVAQLSALGTCYGAVALTSIWAMLGFEHPATRSAFVILVAAGAGLVAALVMDRGSVRVFWVSTVVIQAMILMCSLFVVRDSGYRLVTIKRPEYESPS